MRRVERGNRVVVAALGASAASAKVLRVGTFKGIAGTFTSIQAAVDKAKPGDWILVGPGDYKELSEPRAKGTARRRSRRADHDAAALHPRHGP